MVPYMYARSCKNVALHGNTQIDQEYQFPLLYADTGIRLEQFKIKLVWYFIWNNIILKKNQFFFLEMFMVLQHLTKKCS